MTTEHTPDELCQMLTTGAAEYGPTTRAAIHLLVFTELPHRRTFVELLDIEDINVGSGEPVWVAHVRSWPALATRQRSSRMSSGTHRLLTLAVSLATGTAVNLRDAVQVGGHAHTRRVVEAMAIATGADEYYAITPTPALDEMLAKRAAMFGEPPA